MGNVSNQAHIKGSSEPIDKDTMMTILKLIDKSICKINYGDIFGTGFFCKIPISNQNQNTNYFFTLITCFHVLKDLKENTINLIINDRTHKFILDKNRIVFKDKIRDIVIIEIRKGEFSNINFLNLDENIYDKNPENIYEQIYILHFEFGNKANYSPGVIKDFKKPLINLIRLFYTCSTEEGSSGGPIINSKNHSVIGVHKGAVGDINLNYGTLIGNSIKIFKNKYKNILNKYIYNNDFVNNNFNNNNFPNNICFNNNNNDFNDYDNNNINNEENDNDDYSDEVSDDYNNDGNIYFNNNNNYNNIICINKKNNNNSIKHINIQNNNLNNEVNDVIQNIQSKAFGGIYRDINKNFEDNNNIQIKFNNINVNNKNNNINDFSNNLNNSIDSNINKIQNKINSINEQFNNIQKNIDKNIKNNNQIINIKINKNEISNNLEKRREIHEHPLILSNQNNKICNICLQKIKNVLAYQCKVCPIIICHNCKTNLFGQNENKNIHSHSLNLKYNNNEWTCSKCCFEYSSYKCVSLYCEQCRINICDFCYSPKNDEQNENVQEKHEHSLNYENINGICDFCLKYINNKSGYKCDKGDLILCLDCYEKIYIYIDETYRYNSHNHDLTITFRNNWNCDICNINYQKKYSYYCKLCDFDVCYDCYSNQVNEKDNKEGIEDNDESLNNLNKIMNGDLEETFYKGCEIGGNIINQCANQ